MNQKHAKLIGRVTWLGFEKGMYQGRPKRFKRYLKKVANSLPAKSKEEFYKSIENLIISLKQRESQ